MPYKNLKKRKEMSRIQSRKYYWKNKEVCLKKDKEYRRINQEKISKRRKIYYLKNKEQILKHKKERYLKVAQHKKEYQQQWRLKNPNYCQEYQQKNLFKIRVAAQRRRILQKDLTISIVQQVYENNIKQFGTLTCYLCLKPISFGQDCLEHKNPLSRGGTNQKDNLDIAHRICNLKKKNKTEQEYRKEIIKC